MKLHGLVGRTEERLAFFRTEAARMIAAGVGSKPMAVARVKLSSDITDSQRAHFCSLSRHQNILTTLADASHPPLVRNIRRLTRSGQDKAYAMVRNSCPREARPGGGRGRRERDTERHRAQVSSRTGSVVSKIMPDCIAGRLR